MKILLFNDNPVVRKLVALSAQKTKDDLSVVWSVDEIEESKYDLLIVDDALYNDEMFQSVKEKVALKSTLYIATRGNPIPQGFDHIINKPFLPTDLVDMFIQIENKVCDSETGTVEKGIYSINLEDTLPDIEHQEDTLEDDFGTDDEAFDFDGLEDLEESVAPPGILDKEEVLEVKELLEDAEDGVLGDEMSALDENDLLLDETVGDGDLEGENLPDEIKDDFSFDEEIFPDEIKGELLNFDDLLEEEALKLEDTILEENKADENIADTFEEIADLKEDSGDDNSSDLLEIGDLGEGDWDEEALEEMDISSLMDDQELENLGSTIEDAVEGLEEGELDRELSSDDFGFELDENILEGLAPEIETTEPFAAGDLDGLDELDMLDENELKRAIGEEVEEEMEDEVEEAVDGVFETDGVAEEGDSDRVEEAAGEENIPAQHSVSPAEGVEALQALLKALSNEEVAKSLKALNISININFGNEK